MVKTAIENNQNLIIEGCYIPHTWAADFDEAYRSNIRAVWLIMTPEYIERYFDTIREHANDIERRLDDAGLSKEDLIRENQNNLQQCQRHNCEYILIDREYNFKLP